ncbi:unnamed protein product [Nesidiocoris tenuis]|uniref:Uncharacterized protein n=1 Tax=Nesidiocoris tenuis TaxID=355587 RepID=A0A6H5GNW2_9HEMI|nr:unnamed protein product [Nesidiocoris tenuis]
MFEKKTFAVCRIIVRPLPPSSTTSAHSRVRELRPFRRCELSTIGSSFWPEGGPAHDRSSKPESGKCRGFRDGSV